MRKKLEYKTSRNLLNIFSFRSFCP